jgi:hypothetical protein
MQLKGEFEGARSKVHHPGVAGDTLTENASRSPYSEKLISSNGVVSLHDRLVAANRFVNRVV